VQKAKAVGSIKRTLYQVRQKAWGTQIGVSAFVAGVTKSLVQILRLYLSKVFEAIALPNILDRSADQRIVGNPEIISQRLSEFTVTIEYGTGPQAPCTINCPFSGCCTARYIGNSNINPDTLF